MFSFLRATHTRYQERMYNKGQHPNHKGKKIGSLGKLASLIRFALSAFLAACRAAAARSLSAARLRSGAREV